MIALALAVYIVGVFACAIYAGWSYAPEWQTWGLFWPVAIPVALIGRALGLISAMGERLRARCDNP